MPGFDNLFFTLLIWTLSFLILFSNRHSPINRWCFATGMLFSLGVFKEYFYFDLAPLVLRRCHPFISAAGFERAYSVMTAVLYDFATPVAFLFALHFSGWAQKNRRRLGALLLLLLLGAGALLLLFPATRTRALQQESLRFWVCEMVYNLAWGLAFSLVMVFTVLRERDEAWRRQKRLVGVIMLPPLWYWLLTIFVIHTLGLKSLFTIWKGNAAIFAVLLAFYVVMAFREGAMGLKLSHMSYAWNSEMRTVSRSAQYTGHMLKNEAAKIEWCVYNLQAAGQEETAAQAPGETAAQAPPELGILLRTARHLREFSDKTRLYAGEVVLHKAPCPMAPLLEACAGEARRRGGAGVRVSTRCGPKECLCCDAVHMREVLQNLVNNALEAVGKQGEIHLAFWHERAGRPFPHPRAVLTVRDSGPGLPEEYRRHLFEPYRTTKGAQDHFGLGLYYCAQVVKKHGGTIEAQSGAGQGTCFRLSFPSEVKIHGG